MFTQTTLAIIGAFLLLLTVVVAVSLLVWDGSVGGDVYMAAVVGPIVGGLIGYVAGTKGVAQGAAAASPTTPTSGV